MPNTPEAFAAFVKAEMAKYRESVSALQRESGLNVRHEILLRCLYELASQLSE